MRDFTGKTAVVTGAASGMGYAFAERFAAEGMNVVLADIESGALQTAVTRLEQQERNVVGFQVNTMRRETLEQVRDQAIERYGKIHVLCNNAGVTSRRDGGLGAGTGAVPVWEVPDSTWDWVMGVNFWGVLYGLQVFVPSMIEHGEDGHIVNTASVAGLIPGASAYSVSKHGVLTLTEGLWHHLRAAESNISASVLCPGFVNTQINEAERNRPSEFGQSIEATEAQRMASRVFLGGGMDPSDVAELVWQAMVNDRLYILPHDGWRDIIRGRIESVLDGQQPVEIDFEQMMVRRAGGEDV
ncbi:MAG: SDR family NAD(P)-dependent oxidoreductase [Chloroflexi bacterium]|nr:SDR family NAD(P)-dependent oxidoreductase [Chloroflexota bacterium]MYF80730.1 SDR family NAD(P)-dependent oxidoreductase [Chloroflexota bacterium]MYI04591.1 SDR family NAD(P)-dependent oxidoreductase [Chloroflexota bacterium]